MKLCRFDVADFGLAALILPLEAVGMKIESNGSRVTISTEVFSFEGESYLWYLIKVKGANSADKSKLRMEVF